MTYLTEYRLWIEGVRNFGSNEVAPQLGICDYLTYLNANGWINTQLYDRARKRLLQFCPVGKTDLHYWWGHEWEDDFCRATACGFLAAQAERGNDGLSN